MRAPPRASRATSTIGVQMTDLHVAADRRRVNRGNVLEVVGLALLAYVPFVLSSPGKVSADTKQYLYLDPSRFLARALYLWDAHVGMGTVPHQQIGYLFPMGPFFWLLHQGGLPVWVAQRLWLGSIVFAAALGARWLFRELGVGRVGALAGALVYMLTPYQLAFTARISVLLLAWAGLPFLVLFAMRARRRGGWRDPALFALTVLVIGSVNASSMELVGIAPLVWVALELCRGRDSARRALAATARIGVLCLGVCLWWLIALRTQAAYGLPVLDLTETLKTVATSSTPTDLLRGLGNWFFYGRDRLGTTLEQTGAFTSGGVVEAASWAIPVLALAAAATVRWRHRAYFVLLVVVGTVIGVGAWPFDDPSAYGRLFRAFSDGTTVGLSLRNTPRVVPIIVLGLAGLLAAGVGALAPRWRELGGIAVVGALVLVAFLPVWRVGYFSSGLERDENIPDYWQAAAAALDAGGASTRVLEIPGSNFAAYRWGNAIEPITPGITDRPYVAREVLPAGTPGSVDLLDALDRRIQEGTLEPDALASIARIMGVGTISLRSDLEFERFDIARPRNLWHLLTDPLPAGLSAPIAFGAPVPNVAAAPQPMIDSLAVGTPSSWGDPPPVALFQVQDPVGIVRTAPSEQPVLLSGDGDGIVDAAAAGLIDGHQLVLESAALTNAQLRQALASGADVVFTDSNRRRSQTYFDRIRDAVGATEPSGSRIDGFRLETFPGTTDDARSVLETRGGTVDASGYVSPSDRPAYAFDGDPSTGWLIDSSVAQGATISLHASRPVRADHITLLQRDGGARQIAAAEVRINGGDPISVDLAPDSFTNGQVVSFPATDVRDVEVRIADIAAPEGAGPNGVGFSEIALGNTAVTETVRLPIDITKRGGAQVDGHRLDVVLSRLRYDPAQRPDDELAMSRRVVIPDARTFGLAGTARQRQRARPGDRRRAGNDGTRDHVLIEWPPPRRCRRAGVECLRRQSRHRVDRRVRVAGRAMDRRQHADALLLRPSRPHLRGRRCPLGADAGAPRGRRRSRALDDGRSGHRHLDRRLARDGDHVVRPVRRAAGTTRRRCGQRTGRSRRCVHRGPAGVVRRGGAARRSRPGRTRRRAVGVSERSGRDQRCPGIREDQRTGGRRPKRPDPRGVRTSGVADEGQQPPDDC